MWNSYKARAKQIYSADVKSFLLVSGAIGIVSAILGTFNGFISGFICAFLLSVVEAIKCHFFFRAFHSGSPDIKASLEDLFKGENFQKLFSIIMTLTFITWMTVLVGTLTLNPILILISMLAIVVANFYFVLVYYLYTANPDQPVVAYFKASFTFMKGHVFDYIFFNIAVSILPLLLCSLVAGVIGTLFFEGNRVVQDFMSTIFMIPFEAYISLAVAGYVSFLIPDAWFSGEIKFS